MNEYDFLYSIINPNFLAKPNDFLEENQGVNLGLQPHRVKIIQNCKKELRNTLYRFNLDEYDFLPFFNKTAQEGLKKFCDYILLIENKHIDIVLIEMKRGPGYQTEAMKQLDASEVFMQYIINSAIRLNKDYRVGTFNPQKIKIKKVVLKRKKSNKIPTKPNKRGRIYNMRSYILWEDADFLDINKILHS